MPTSITSQFMSYCHVMLYAHVCRHMDRHLLQPSIDSTASQPDGMMAL
jgi:hypothetical protein